MGTARYVLSTLVILSVVGCSQEELAQLADAGAPSELAPEPEPTPTPCDFTTALPTNGAHRLDFQGAYKVAFSGGHLMVSIFDNGDMAYALSNGSTYTEDGRYTSPYDDWEINNSASITLHSNYYVNDRFDLLDPVCDENGIIGLTLRDLRGPEPVDHAATVDHMTAEECSGVF